MFPAIEYYQSLAEKFQSRILTVPGIIVVVTGLCIWLAGLRWRKTFAAIAGGGTLAAIAVSLGRNDVPVVLTVVLIGISVGALIEKIVLGFFGAAAAAVIVLLIMSANLQSQPNSGYVPQDSYPKWPQYQQGDIAINPSQAAEITIKMASYFAERAIAGVKSAPMVAFAAAAVTALVAGFIALLMPRLFIAVISSSLGSAIIFTGILMLLFYKCSKPVNYIAEKNHFFSMVFAAMILFGTVIQLILSPPAVKQIEDYMPVKKKGDKK